MKLLDALAFSSVWVAAAAAALVVAASNALGATPDARAILLAAAGTLGVYGVDRLRDLSRDRLTTPLRTAFVERHRRVLTLLTAAALLTAASLALAAGPRVVALLAPVALAGFLHRRLKRFAFAKPLYLVCAWLAVVVGVPALLAVAPPKLGWTSGILACAILANAIASNVRDDEAGAARIGAARALAIARSLALLGTALAALAPEPVRSLLPVPALTLAALVPFRASERYGLLVVDGALLAGGLLAAFA